MTLNHSFIVNCIFYLRREGDSNPRYPNRVRQFSKLVVSATHPPLQNVAQKYKIDSYYQKKPEKT